MENHVTTAALRQAAERLRAGDRIFLSGTVYTARDAAHKRLMALIDQGAPLPFDLQDAVIYYAGATPAPTGLPIGACGPTTSSRMDPYAPRLYRAGVCATVGKGQRSSEVLHAIAETDGIYLCAVGGAGALCARHITACEVIAFDDLGCESIKRLTFCEFPLIVGVDSNGGTIFNRE